MTISQFEEQKMKLKVIHFWVPAFISFIFALLFAFSGEIIGTTIFTSVYLFLITSTKWANNETYR
jgi:hypothetical protein